MAEKTSSSYSLATQQWGHHLCM